MKRIESADWSTINLEALAKLPQVTLSGGRHLQSDSGNGCSGDPPGFPTYYTRSVYSAEGNEPRSGAAMVIGHQGTLYEVENVHWPKGETWETHSAKRDALMRSLWKPLPLDHPRTQAWILATFLHHRHCYQVPELRAQGKNWSDAMLIWPGGTLGKTPFGSIEDIEFQTDWAKSHEGFDKWRPEEQEKFKADILANNERISRLCAEVATPDNHDGTIIVRRYYHEFIPTPALLDPKQDSPGNWWEVLSERPSPENCPGQYDMVHPCNGSWCQMCGWHAPKDLAA